MSLGLRRSGPAFTRGSPTREALCSLYTRGLAGGGLLIRSSAVSPSMRVDAICGVLPLRLHSLFLDKTQRWNARREIPGIPAFLGVSWLGHLHADDTVPGLTDAERPQAAEPRGRFALCDLDADDAGQGIRPGNRAGT